MKLSWLISAVLVLSACSKSTPTNQQTDHSTDSAVIHLDTVANAPEEPIIVAQSLPKGSNDKSFRSADEAYDEGYYNGHQEGYSDATHHLDYGYYYDDEPEYSGFLQAYVDGYENGYDDGYNEGMEWNSEND